MTNPAVRDEVAKVIGFWLELGVSGFQGRALPFFIEVLPDAGRRRARPPRLPARAAGLPQPPHR